MAETTTQNAPTTTQAPAQSSTPATRSSGSPSGASVQLKAMMRGMNGFDEQAAALAPMQAKGPVQRAEGVQEAAAQGVAGASGSLPHGAQIQKAFGEHDVSGVKSQVGGGAAEASQAIGAEAYAMGDRVAFQGAPDLHTAAHEAAHVVQQRAGVSLPGGVGQSGDAHEQHADKVADAVVAGDSAADLLSGGPGGGGGSSAVQCYAGNQDVPVAAELGGDGETTVAEAQAANHGAVERDVHQNPAIKARFEGELAAALLVDSQFYHGTVVDVSKKIYEYIELKAKAGEGEADQLINAELDKLTGLYGGAEAEGKKVNKWEKDLYFGRLTDTKAQLAQGSNDPYQAIRNVLQGGGGTIPNQMYAHHQFMDHIYGKDMQHQPEMVSKILSTMHARADAEVQAAAVAMEPKQLRTQVEGVGANGANPFGMVSNADGPVRSESGGLVEDKNSGRWSGTEEENNDGTTKRHARGRFGTREGAAATAADQPLNSTMTDKAKQNDGIGARVNTATGIHGGHLVDPETNEKLGAESGGEQRHGRGVDIYTLDEAQLFVQEARVKYDMPMAAGISGTTTDLLECAIAMGVPAGMPRFKYTLGALAQLMGAGAHSFHEIMSAAVSAGVPYTPGSYLSVYDSVGAHNSRVKLIFEREEYKDVKGISPALR